MANMSYCRFHNTLGDLQDCYDAMTNGDSISREEAKARYRLVELCKQIAADFEDDFSPDDGATGDDEDNE